MSRADKITSRTKELDLYSDFLINFDLNPISGEIARTTNERSVIRAMKNLINTNRGERITSSAIGCGLKKLLFEPFDDITKDLIRSAITVTIEQFEPRVKLIQVDVQPREEQDAYVIFIIFAMINAPSERLQFSTVLRRIR